MLRNLIRKSNRRVQSPLVLFVHFLTSLRPLCKSRFGAGCSRAIFNWRRQKYAYSEALSCVVWLNVQLEIMADRLKQKLSKKRQQRENNHSFTLVAPDERNLFVFFFNFKSVWGDNILRVTWLERLSNTHFVAFISTADQWKSMPESNVPKERTSRRKQRPER